jgi:F-type H+-transporting ATPase subunit b
MYVGAAASFSIDNFLLWLSELVGFLLLIAFFVFKRFGKGEKRRSIAQTVAGVLDARAAKVDEQLRAAEESRAEAQKAHEEAQAEIARAHEESKAIITRAESMSQSLREEMVVTAEADKNRIVAQARDEIEAERNRAVTELRTRAADVAIDAAREVLKQTMDQSADQAFIDRALLETTRDSNGSDHEDRQ